MRFGWARGVLLLAMLAAAGLTGGIDPAAHAAVTVRALGPDAPSRVRRWLRDIPLEEPLDGGHRWSQIQVDGVRIRIALTLADGWEAASVLRPRGPDHGGGETTPSFEVTRENPTGDPVVAGHLLDAVESLRAHDDGRFWEVVHETVDHGPDPRVDVGKPVPGAIDALPVRESPPPQESDWYPAMQSLIAAGLLLLMLILWALILRHRGEPLSARGLFRSDILVPITLQVVLLLYWSLYWDEVSRHVSSIAATLAFGLALDLILRLALRREGLFHLAVFPVVLSMHLFVWFDREDFWLGFLVVAIALASKVTVKRDGRHVFNPSALGIAVVGVLCYLAPGTFRYVDIAHPFNLPPSMFEVVLCLAIVAQWRVPIVLVSLGVVLVQWVAVILGGPEAMIPSVHWAPVTLAVVLLATDPATIPRTGGGRLLFGACYGVLMVSSSLILESNGISDFFTKVLPIPVCNWLVPTLDAAAARLSGKWTQVLSETWNKAHILLWLIVMLVPWWWTDTKARLFEGHFHAIHETPHVVLRGRSAHCEDNPAFCAPFSLREEWMFWLDQREQDGDHQQP